MNWYFAALKKSYLFSGRARRREFALFATLAFLFLLVCVGIGKVLYGFLPKNALSEEGIPAMLIPSFLYLLVVFFPMTSVAVRRFHDMGLSGFWLIVLYASPYVLSKFFWLQLFFEDALRMFALLFVGIAVINFLVLFLVDGQHGENKYGPDPKGRPKVEKLKP
ncbi:MAG: DUF805 domain-containing protein [Puniceicoccales bacterium]|jgi:uncharacterized membrane protein YhaH (DUF805 family)|nr:DUF805 domain-containing protein [Puniceicoccales bacterium]